MVDRCIVCGEPVPEGRHVCPVCEERIMKNPPGENRVVSSEDQHVKRTSDKHS